MPERGWQNHSKSSLTNLSCNITFASILNIGEIFLSAMVVVTLGLQGVSYVILTKGGKLKCIYFWWTVHQCPACDSQVYSLGARSWKWKGELSTVRAAGRCEDTTAFTARPRATPTGHHRPQRHCTVFANTHRSQYYLQGAHDLANPAVLIGISRNV